MVQQIGCECVPHGYFTDIGSTVKNNWCPGVQTVMESTYHSGELM